MTNSDVPLNAVERRQNDAIVAAGNDPADWLIEPQLATWEQRSGWPLTPELAAELRRLSGEAASRFELVERLQVYSLAEACIRTMQEMSFDRQALQPAQFRIATEPGSLLHPRVQAEWHARPPGDDGASASNSIIWMPVNALLMFSRVAGVISNRLIKQVGDLESLIAAFARNLTWYEALEFLRMHRLPNVVTPSEGESAILLPEPPDQPPNSHDPIREGATVMNIAATVFVAGHEAGHLYLGHFGDRNPIEAILGGRSISPNLRREMEADSVGINAVWDGLASNGLSIDITFVGPVVVALAASAGLAAAHPRTDYGTTNDTWQDWVYRLRLAIRVLGEWLIGNGLGLTRSGPILAAAAPLAACIYEYVRTGGDLADGNGRLGAPGAEVYAMLEDTALPLLERFGQLGDNPSDPTP